MEKENWKSVVLKRLVERNRVQTVPFYDIYINSSKARAENLSLTLQLNEIRGQIISLQHEFNASLINTGLSENDILAKHGSKLTQIRFESQPNLSSKYIDQRRYLAGLSEELLICKEALTNSMQLNAELQDKITQLEQASSNSC
jgi:hypothetical protein